MQISRKPAEGYIYKRSYDYTGNHLQNVGVYGPLSIYLKKWV